VKKKINPGSSIIMHGLDNFGFVGKNHVYRDWALGCIATTNQEIREIYNLVSVGTKIEIRL